MELTFLPWINSGDLTLQPGGGVPLPTDRPSCLNHLGAFEDTISGEQVMEQRILGAIGMAVSVLGFGTVNLGAWGKVDQNAANRLVGQALDGGITLFDTADLYSFGEAETLLGKALGA